MMDGCDVPSIKSVFDITEIKVDISLPNIVQFYIFIFPIACAAHTNLCIQGEAWYLGFNVKRLYLFYFQHI